VTTNEFERLERDLEEALAAPVPGLRFSASRAAAKNRNPRRWMIGAAAGAVALVAAVIVLPNLSSGGATQVSAEELISRSNSAAEALRSGGVAYHLRGITEAKGGTTVLETWSLGEGGSRSENVYQANGATEVFGFAMNSDGYWIYRTASGVTRVAHVADQKDDRLRIAEPGDLDSAIRKYTIPNCMSATLAGEATVAGRSGYVVDIKPTPETCTADPARPDSVKLAAVAKELGSTRLVIDKQTSVQLEVETFDGDGQLNSKFMVNLFETGTAVDAMATNYRPPAGAIVSEVDNYGDAKSVLVK